MPDWAPYVRPRLASLRLPPARESEIIEELSQHLDDRFREALAGGATPEEAVRIALAEFRGRDTLARYISPLRQANPPLAITPGAPAGRWLSDVWHDLRYAARMLAKRRGFTFAALLTLSIGVGANAAIFSVVHAVLLRPLSFADGDELVSVYTRYLPSSGYDFPYFALSGPEFADIRARVDAFDGIAAYRFSFRNLLLPDGAAERVLTIDVTGEFFDVLGVKPAIGRTFTEDEGQRGDGCLALLGHDASVANERAVGSTIRLDDAPCLVVGVLPRGVIFRDSRVKVWRTLAIDTKESPQNRQSHGLSAVARLRDGVTAEDADARLQSLRAYWAGQYPDHYATGHFAVVRSLREDVVGDQRDALLLLGAAVLFVLLIVCVNVAALLVSYGEARRREFALRHALGANRWRLVRQLVVEAMLLVCAGGVLGLVLAPSVLAGLLALYPQRLPVAETISIDRVALLWMCVLVVAAGVLVGIVPALSATGMRMQDALRGDARTAAGTRRAVAARSLLVVGQLAMSVVLLAGALLLIRSYRQLQQVELGVAHDAVLTFGLSIPPGRQPDPAAARRTLAAIEEQLTRIREVETAGAISNLPLSSAGPPDDFAIDGRAKPSPGAPAWNARYLMVTPRLFRSFGIPLKGGRLLEEGDISERPLVAVINEAAARLYWPAEDPIGKTIRYYPVETSPAIQIVGIVGDVRSMGANQPAPPAVYVPFAQAPRPQYEGRSMTFVVRAASGDPASIGPQARAAVAAIDAGLPLANVRTMTEVVSASASQPRFTMLVVSFFAGIAFLLAGLGLYGILAYSVEQRTREIGVRVALGASRREIFKLIIGNGVLLAVAGIIVGVPAALAATRMMAGVLAGVASTDPMTYAAVAAMLAAAAVLASYVPAHRATRVDPLIALRAE